LDLFVIQYISESRNISIDLYKGDNIYALGSIKISRQRSNCTREYYHGKVSSDHLTFLSLGLQWCVARYRSLFIVLNIRFNIIANVTRTYRVTHKEQSKEKYISMNYIRGAHIICLWAASILVLYGFLFVNC